MSIREELDLRPRSKWQAYKVLGTYMRGYRQVGPVELTISHEPEHDCLMLRIAPSDIIPGSNHRIDLGWLRQALDTPFGIIDYTCSAEGDLQELKHHPGSPTVQLYFRNLPDRHSLLVCFYSLKEFVGLLQ